MDSIETGCTALPSTNMAPEGVIVHWQHSMAQNFSNEMVDGHGSLGIHGTQQEMCNTHPWCLLLLIDLPLTLVVSVIPHYMFGQSVVLIFEIRDRRTLVTLVVSGKRTSSYWRSGGEGTSLHWWLAERLPHYIGTQRK